MCNKMKFLYFIFMLTYMANYCHAANQYLVRHEQWFLPKNVQSVLAMEPVAGVLSEFDKSPESQLLMVYPGGDEGTLWAHELKAWLVSFGISSRQIELRPGSGDSGIIELRIDKPDSSVVKTN